MMTNSQRQKWINYDDFVEKFKPKKTTDDCYTPEAVYNAIRDWVCEEYGLDASKFVRPFYPGGDYEGYDYPEDCVVVDNPPFSILSQIISFYIEAGIKFFLFAPALMIFNNCYKNVCALCLHAEITYENGARVPTSFITNLESPCVRSAPELYKRIEEADKANNQKVLLPKYQYPDEVLTATKLNYLSKNGVDFKAETDELFFIRALDMQRQYKKGIFGAGFLMSELKAAELKAANDKIKKEVIHWQLSEREREIVNALG